VGVTVRAVRRRELDREWPMRRGRRNVEEALGVDGQLGFEWISRVRLTFGDDASTDEGKVDLGVGPGEAEVKGELECRCADSDGVAVDSGDGEFPAP